MNLTPLQRKIALISACVIIALAVLWLFIRGNNDERSRICGIINSYGYSFHRDDLLIAYDNASTSIKEVATEHGEDIDIAVQASKSAGFASDIDKIGGVTLLLATDGNDVVTIYILDGEIELCFVQTEDGEIKPIGE